MKNSQDAALRAKLNIAVQRLKGQGIIKSNKDIATDLNFAEPTVSQQLTGSKPLSVKFILKFEKKYKMSVSTIVLPAKNRKPVAMDINTRLLLLIAEKVGVEKKKLDNALHT